MKRLFIPFGFLLLALPLGAETVEPGSDTVTVEPASDTVTVETGSDAATAEPENDVAVVESAPAQSVLVDAPEGAKPKVVATAKMGKATAPEKDIQLSRVPGMTTREMLDMPKNLARWHMGAVLFVANDGPLQPFNWRDADDGQSAGLLLGDDPSAELDLIPDTYKYVMELNDYYLVRRFTFKNFTAIGTLQVFSAASLANSNSKEWKPLADPVKFSGEGYVSVRFDEVDTRHIMVVFDITTEGSIGIFGLYGDMSVAETRVPRTHQDAEQMVIASTPDEDTTKFNFGSVSSGSKISHINKGDPSQVQNMNDDDVETSFEFPEDSTEDVMIIDLAEQQEINRVSMLFEAPPGVFDLFLTNDLPEGMKELEEPADGAAEEQPTAEAPAEGSGDEEMAADWQPVYRPEMLLAASPGSLGEWLALAALAAGPDVTQVTLPKSFFDDNKHAMQFEVDGTIGRFRADFEIIEMRYMIIRFTPSAGNPPGSGGLKVFEIGLFGDVPEERRRVVRVPVFDFFENAVDTTVELAPPTGGEDGSDTTPGGGGAPRPPPVVSP